MEHAEHHPTRDAHINLETGDDAKKHMAGAAPALMHLSDMDDCDIGEDEPDIRGWDVKTADGVEIGEVEDLIVDTVTMKVRYLEVELDKKALDLKEDRWVLIPIGTARLNDDEDVVVVSRNSSDLAGMPNYERGKLNNEYEKKLSEGYGGNHFDDTDFYGNRRQSTSSTYIVRERQD